ncbi:MAG TPA: lipid-binding SYLF domain-containing protein [Terracidiphilus sp.]|jgi:lipid-binding SYLF domain-containing protein|nr:lipid-binding SYLF domain-containing protein [Terracidiphilus sp.]
MKKLMMMAAVLSLATYGWADSQDTTKRLENAGSVLHEIMAAPDKGIPDEVFEHAKCVAVVPHMVKGGFIFGAQGGRGVATCRTTHGWSAPAFFAITGGSWGLQIGVEGVDLVMIIQNDAGMQRLLSSKFQIGGDASAAAGPVGRHASANTDWKMNAEILTYSRAKGAFAGLDLSGSAIRRDDDSMKAFYGDSSSTSAVLNGEVPPPPAARPFLEAVKGARAEAASASK